MADDFDEVAVIVSMTVDTKVVGGTNRGTSEAPE